MGNLPPHMLDQIQQAQERARATDDQAAPSKKARLALMQASNASQKDEPASRLAIDPSLTGLSCFFCRESIAPINKTHDRATRMALPCRHAYHEDCLCAHWYSLYNPQESCFPIHDDDSPKCPSCHQAIVKLQDIVVATVPAPNLNKDAIILASALEADDPNMEDILRDIRNKLWDNNHKVASAALRMLVQIVHSDIDSDSEDEDDESDDDEEKDDENYSDMALRLGLPVVLVYCLTRHGSDHADVTKMVLGILEWLVSKEDAACRLIPRVDNALVRVIEAMQRTPSDGPLQYNGLQVLNKVLNDETRVVLNSSGVVGATFQAMQSNQQDGLVQEAALQLLSKFVADSDFAAKAVVGFDEQSRQRSARCVAGSLFCIAREPSSDADAILACGHLIIRLATSNADFQDAIYKIIGAPIKQVFVNHGQDAAVKRLYQDVLRCLVKKKPDSSFNIASDDRKMAATSSSSPADNESKLPSQNSNDKNKFADGSEQSNTEGDQELQPHSGIGEDSKMEEQHGETAKETDE